MIETRGWAETAGAGGALSRSPEPALGDCDLSIGPDDRAALRQQLLGDVAALRGLRIEAAMPLEGEGEGAAALPLEGEGEGAAAVAALTGRAAAVVQQLRPLRTRASLLASYTREAAHPAEVRLAYAMMWLALGQAAPGALVRRRRARRAALLSR